MSREPRKIVGVSFTLPQIAKFTATQKKLQRATLAPIVADCAIIGLPIYQKMMNGGPSK